MTGELERPAAEAGTSAQESSPEQRPVPALTVAAAAFLASAGGAFVAGGLFQDPSARVLGALGALIGAGLVGAGYRSGRPLVPQLLAVPAAALAGAVAALAGAPPGATIPALVGAAIRSGGLLQPPIPFDPGWRFLLIVLSAALAAAAAGVGLTLRRPRLAALLPLVLTGPAALLQPSGAQVVSAAGAIALTSLALAAARGADLRAEGGTPSLRFETARLGRSLAATAGLVLVLVLIAQTGFLFPQQQRSRSTPAQRPHPTTPLSDQILFTYRSSRQVPLRMGVLDEYDGAAWLLPPFDTGRLVTLNPPASVPSAPSGRDTFKVQIALGSLQGRGVPMPAEAQRIQNGDAVQYDPRTLAVRLAAGSARPGLGYTVVALVPPTSDALEAQIGAPPPSLREYLQVPPPPAEVLRLLEKAPVDPFARLTVLRQQLYTNVIAEGQGTAVEVRPNRVAAMLQGAKASPYEITAAEALLARWAGLPSRIGYGYYGGDQLPSGAFAVHPVHAATWLEVYFKGLGWTPLVGVPLHATDSLAQPHRNPNQAVQASSQLSLVVYVPLVERSAVLLYEEARWYLLAAAPWVLLALLAWFLSPAVARQLRRRRRRRWALRRGPRERVAAAYAEFRDACHDLSIGDGSAPPLDFLASIVADAEHTELAWLATRVLWGDLRRDARPEDADAAEALSQSLRRRIAGAQPLTTRLLALGSRGSLREPFSTELPNLWFRARSRSAPVRTVAAAVSAALVLLLLAGTAAGAAPASSASHSLAGLVPPSLGRLELHRESAAEAAFTKVRGAAVVQGRVYSLRHDGIVEGSIQEEVLGPGLEASDGSVTWALRSTIAGGGFRQLLSPVPAFDGTCDCRGDYRLRPVYQQAAHGRQRVWEADPPGLRVFMWFPPHRDVMMLVAVRAEFPRASTDALVLALIDLQHGLAPGPVPVPLPGVLESAPAGSGT